MDVGLVTYDAEARKVRYTGHRRVESLLSHVASLAKSATAEASVERNE